MRIEYKKEGEITGILDTMISNSDYHGLPNIWYLSSSDLKKIVEKSGDHVMYDKMNPPVRRGKEIRNKHFDFGNAFHSKVLEPGIFNDDYYRDLPITVDNYPDAIIGNDAMKNVIREWNEGADKNDKYKLSTLKNKADLMKVCKVINPNIILFDEIKEGISDLRMGRTPISEDDWDLMNKMETQLQTSDMFTEHFIAGEGEKSLSEVSFFCADFHGIQVKVRPDRIKFLQQGFDDQPTVVSMGDLKTTRRSSWKGFKLDVVSYGYHTSAALYIDVIAKVTGKAPDFHWIACEKSSYCPTAWYQISDKMYNEGQRNYMEGIEKALETRQKDRDSDVHPVFNGYPAEYVMGMI